MVTLVNMTSHNIDVMDTNGVWHVIPPSGVEMRRSVKPESIDPIVMDDGTTFFRSRMVYGDTSPIPDKIEGTYYIVSTLCLSDPLLAGRDDLLGVGEQVWERVGENPKGKLLGVKGFAAQARLPEAVKPVDTSVSDLSYERLVKLVIDGSALSD